MCTRFASATITLGEKQANYGARGSRDTAFGSRRGGLLAGGHFTLVLGIGAVVLALPLVFSVLFRVFVWPMAGFIDVKAALRPGSASETVGRQFWFLWRQALLFLLIYGAVGGTARAVVLERQESRAEPGDDRKRGQTRRPAATLSWPTFWFVAAAVAVGNLAASAARAVLPSVTALLTSDDFVVAAVPVSRVAVALALATTGGEWWAETWRNRRRAPHGT